MYRLTGCFLLAASLSLSLATDGYGQGHTGMEFAKSVGRQQSEMFREMLSKDPYALGVVLKQKNPDECVYALLALGEKQPGTASPALPALAKILEDDSTREPFYVTGKQRGGETARSATVPVYRALGKCGPKAAPLVVRLLRESMDARAIDSVRAGCDALGFIGVDNPEVIEILQSPKTAWARNARNALARIRPNK